MKIKDTEIKIVQGKKEEAKADYIVKGINDACINELKIRYACRAAFKSAQKVKAKSIMFPALGCRKDGFSLKASAKIMAQEVLRYVRDTKGSLKKIIFCVDEKKACRVFTKNILGYLDYIHNKLKSPFVTVDAIIEMKEGVVLIKRSNPPFGWALPGGFVDYGESLEQAVVREAKEETGLDLTSLRQFHTYSDPKRDPRFHTIGTVFIAKAKGSPKAGDDAAGVRIVKLSQIAKLDFAFDHKKILLDYLKTGLFKTGS